MSGKSRQWSAKLTRETVNENHEIKLASTENIYHPYVVPKRPPFCKPLALSYLRRPYEAMLWPPAASTPLRSVNAFNIDPFVLALTDPSGHAQAWPNCDRNNADCNGDGVVNAFDIDPFVELLVGG